MTPLRLLEPQLKARLLSYLREKKAISAADVVINEMVLANYQRRADLVTVSPKQLIIYEIKSEADSLSRLSGQLDLYLQFANKVIVVCAPKHTKGVLAKTPPAVAVWEMTSKKTVIKQRGRQQKNIDRDSALTLMSANELRPLVTKQGIRSSGLSRGEMLAALANASPVQCRDAALAAVIKRFSPTNHAFWQQVDGEPITPAHLLALSPYKAERDREKARVKLNKDSWARCIASMQALADEQIEKAIPRKPASESNAITSPTCSLKPRTVILKK